MVICLIEVERLRRLHPGRTFFVSLFVSLHGDDTDEPYAVCSVANLAGVFSRSMGGRIGADPVCHCRAVPRTLRPCAYLR